MCIRSSSSLGDDELNSSNPYSAQASGKLLHRSLLVSRITPFIEGGFSALYSASPAKSMSAKVAPEFAMSPCTSEQLHAWGGKFEIKLNIRRMCIDVPSALHHATQD